MGGQSKPGPTGTATNNPQIDAGTSNRNQSHPPGAVGSQPAKATLPVEPPPPTVNLPASDRQFESIPLSIDELWKVVQSKRGFESSPSPFKKEQGDQIRRIPATVHLDPRGRGSPLGDPVETFAAIQIIDKNGRRLAIGSDYFDKGPLRGPEADKLDKHAESRVLRALEQAVPGEVPEGSLIGLVDQDVCPACAAKLEAFAKMKKLRLVVMHVPERPKLGSAPGMASPKQTSRTSLQDLHDRAGNPVKVTYRESFKKEFSPPEPAGPKMPPTSLKSRMSSVGVTIGEALVTLLLDLVAAKVREKIDRSKFEDEMRKLEPAIDQRKLEAYNAARAKGDLQANGGLYYNIEIRITTKTMIYVAGVHSNMMAGSPKPEIQSVRISNQRLSSQGPVHESSKQPSAIDPVLWIEQTQVVTYSDPLTELQ